MYHPEIDNARFMEASTPVMRFILKSKKLFKKPYIALLLKGEDRTWSCFITFSADQYGQGEPKDGETACGYVYFDPCAKNAAADDENHGQPNLNGVTTSEANAVSMSSFFLMVAYYLHNCDKPPENADDPSAWFESIDDFATNVMGGKEAGF